MCVSTEWEPRPLRVRSRASVCNCAGEKRSRDLSRCVRGVKVNRVTPPLRAHVKISSQKWDCLSCSVFKMDIQYDGTFQSTGICERTEMHLNSLLWSYANALLYINATHSRDCTDLKRQFTSFAPQWWMTVSLTLLPLKFVMNFVSAPLILATVKNMKTHCEAIYEKMPDTHRQGQTHTHMHAQMSEGQWATY